MVYPDGGASLIVKKIHPILKRALSHLFTKSATNKYPFEKPTLPHDSRGQIKYEIKDCNIINFASGCDFTLDVKSIMGSNCQVCFRDCPANAIEIVEVDGKKRPQIDLNHCIFCYQCVESCPRQAIKASELYELATTDKGTLIMKPNFKGEKSQ